jgi:hypothetical protein
MKFLSLKVHRVNAFLRERKYKSEIMLTIAETEKNIVVDVE